MLHTNHLFKFDDDSIAEADLIMMPWTDWVADKRSKSPGWSVAQVKRGGRICAVAVKMTLTGPLPHPATIGFWADGVGEPGTKKSRKGAR